MWKNTVEPDRPQMTKWSTRIACWIPKATNTHSEYVILISFPLQKWLHASSSILRYLYIAHCVNNMTKLCKNEWRMRVWHREIFFWIRMEVSHQVQGLTAQPSLKKQLVT
jgi:hypothetical protein